MLEILSPAGSVEAVQAAVRSGADAVYLGLEGFNARRNARNFTESDLMSAIKYCHARGVRVYLTLNTLVRNGEIESALKTAEIAAKCGVDAFILQDLGLSEIIRERFPEVPMHASTQLSVHSYKAIPLLHELGFSRIVPSREMDMESLSRLCAEAKKYGMEVEVFVHGALCMSLSGECYLSGMLGGRSGNRGLCAGPCRLPFSVEGGTGHDLSLKDLNMLSHMDELIKMGVTSFKIEGRMKRPEYVAAATHAYRLAADGEKVPDEHLKMLGEVFSRGGFTDGYFTGDLGRQMFGFRSEEDERLTVGVLRSIHEIYRGERRAVALTAQFTADENGSTLIFSDGAQQVTVRGAAAQTAKNMPLTNEAAFRQLSRLGGSPFYLTELKFKIPSGLTVPAGQLNAMRRKAVEQLSEMRAECYYRTGKTSAGKVSALQTAADKEVRQVLASNGKPRLLAAFRSLEQLPQDISAVDGIILPLEADFENYNGSKPLFVDIPRGMLGTEEYISNRLKQAIDAGVKAAFCGNLAALKVCREAGIPAVADFGMNLTNSGAVDAASHLGFSAAVLSFENTASDIKHITEKEADNGINRKSCANDNNKMPLGVIIYGRLALMLCRNCPQKNGGGCAQCGGFSEITDRLGVTFPFACRNGFTELYNSRPVCVADRQTEFGLPDFLVARFTFETREECEQLIKEIAVGASPHGEYTRGLYYRAVK